MSRVAQIGPHRSLPKWSGRIYAGAKKKAGKKWFYSFSRRNTQL